MYVRDFVGEVQAKLANRDDAGELAPYWIRDAVRELTDSSPFTELEQFGPLVNLTPNVSDYDINTFVNQQEKWTEIALFELFVDPPSNTISKPVLFREIAVVRPMSRIPAMPSYFSRYGRTIVFGNKPDQSYQVAILYQKVHPFHYGMRSDELRNQLLNDEVLMPAAWDEIIWYAAALRGAIELRLPDYISMYEQILHGDPEDQTKPGILKKRLFQHQRDKRMNNGQMAPIVGRY